MKKITIIPLLLILSVPLFSQQTDTPPPLTKEDYLRKRRHQQTAAWLLIGGGVILASTALFIEVIESTTDLLEPGQPSQKASNTPTVLYITGGAMILGSIPLFAIASENKKKARDVTISFKNEKTLQVQNYGFVSRPVPSLSLSMSL